MYYYNIFAIDVNLLVHINYRYKVIQNINIMIDISLILKIGETNIIGFN